MTVKREICPAMISGLVMAAMLVVASMAGVFVSRNGHEAFPARGELPG